MGAPLRLGYPKDREEVRGHRLGAILARWHCWRGHYRTERGYARAHGARGEPEDVVEHMLMATIEREVACLPVELQRAIGQLAQAECLGVQAHPQGGAHHLALIRIGARLTALGLL